MGLEIAQAIEVVCSMNRSDFFKSMTTLASSRVWQDVYHPQTPVGLAYVKVTVRQDGAVVIQFKEK
jgi:motility quorum-sensing regulator/GCU-specific mRNA interferase toxin